MSVQNITGKIKKIIESCEISEGLCSLFLSATTAGFMINEYDRMLIEDFRREFGRIDEKKPYAHPKNAFAHLRAAMLPCCLTIPVSDNTLALGPWQSILLWEFDIEPRSRDIIVTVTGT